VTSPTANATVLNTATPTAAPSCRPALNNVEARPVAEERVDPGGDLSARHDPYRLRERAEPGVERGQAEAFLEEQRHQEQTPEQGHGAQHHDRRGRPEQGVAQHPQRDHRLA
jgi:hypothetical protein